MPISTEVTSPGPTPAGRSPKATVKVSFGLSYSSSCTVCSTAVPTVSPEATVMLATSVTSPAAAAPVSASPS